MSELHVTPQEIGAFLVLMMGWLGSLLWLYIALDKRMSAMEISFKTTLENGLSTRIRALEESTHDPNTCSLRADLAELRGIVKGHA